MNVFARFDEIPQMTLKNAGHKIIELHREITLTELVPSPYISMESICLADMNEFARNNDSLRYVENKLY